MPPLHALPLLAVVLMAQSPMSPVAPAAPTTAPAGTTAAAATPPPAAPSIAESFRQEKGVEDNRSSKFWLDDDLQLQSVEDRLRMYEKWASKCEGLGARQLVQQGSEPSPTQARRAQAFF
jgi:hypothetical protein